MSVYDQFVATHRFAGRAHGTSEFLPWHREFIRRFELALETADPSVSLPYWNWGLGTREETEGLFQEGRMGPLPERADTVASGYFSVTGVNGHGWTPALERGGRKPFDRLPTRAQVLGLLDLPSHESLGSDPALRGSELEGLHGGTPHIWIGGAMRDRTTSPNDPIFFLHHAQIDRIWSIWQMLHPQAAWTASNAAMWPWDGSPLGADAAARVPNLSPLDRVRPTDVLDTEALGYVYDGYETRFEFDERRNVSHAWARVDFDSSYDKPAVVACVATFSGSNSVAARMRNAGRNGMEVRVEKQRSRDQKVAHTLESIAWVAGDAGVVFNVSGGPVGEIGRIRMGYGSKDQPEPVPLCGEYVGSPVVVASISSRNGEHAAHMRVVDTSSGPFLHLEGWLSLDGLHHTEEVSYLAVESGRHTLRSGIVIQADRLVVDHGWRRIDALPPDFDVLLTQCMSVNDPDPVATRQRKDDVGFEVRLQEKDRDGTHAKESVGYVALKGR